MVVVLVPKRGQIEDTEDPYNDDELDLKYFELTARVWRRTLANVSMIVALTLTSLRMLTC